jgi:hypothetical protein
MSGLNPAPIEDANRLLTTGVLRTHMANTTTVNQIRPHLVRLRV